MRLPINMVIAVLGAINVVSSLAFMVEAKSLMTHGVANASLAAAARKATLKDIDYGSTYCDSATTVESWLTQLTGRDARSIAWAGGKCQLINELNPLDAGGRWCAQAGILLVHPKDQDDEPTIEIYLEVPKNSRPGRAYAFRSVMKTRDGDWDYLRSRKEFEAEWRERFPSDTNMPICED